MALPKLDTVKVKAEDKARGFKIINARDFTPGVHEMFDDVSTDDTPEPVTKESIMKMKKSDVIELLELHGVAEPDTSAKVADLRELLTKVMFVDDDELDGDDNSDLLG